MSEKYMESADFPEEEWDENDDPSYYPDVHND